MAGNIILASVGIISGGIERSVLNQIAEAPASGVEQDVWDVVLAAAERSDLTQTIVGGIQFLVAILGLILFFRWVYIAACNCFAMVEYPLKITPGWSVGWYFVPIMNLWKPFEAMRQSWNISHSPSGDPVAPPPGIIWQWWLLWVIESEVGKVAFKSSMKGDGVPELLNANLAMLLSDLLALPTSLYTYVLVGRIAAAQAASMAKPLPPTPEAQTVATGQT